MKDGEALLSQPWVGASWEGFVIEQAIGTLSARGVPFEAYFFRTSDRHEINLVLDFGGELWAVEIKLTASPASSDMAKLEKAADMIGTSKRFLVSQVRQSSGDQTRISCNLAEFIRHLGSWEP